MPCRRSSNNNSNNEYPTSYFVSLEELRQLLGEVLIPTYWAASDRGYQHLVVDLPGTGGKIQIWFSPKRYGINRVRISPVAQRPNTHQYIQRVLGANTNNSPSEPSELSGELVLSSSSCSAAEEESASPSSEFDLEDAPLQTATSVTILENAPSSSSTSTVSLIRSVSNSSFSTAREDDDGESEEEFYDAEWH